MATSKRRINRRQIAFRVAGFAALLAFVLIGPWLQAQVSSWNVAEQAAQLAGFNYPTPLDVLRLLGQVAGYSGITFNCIFPVVVFVTIYELVLMTFSMIRKLGQLLHPHDKAKVQHTSTLASTSLVLQPDEQLKADFTAVTPFSLVDDEAYFIPAWKLSPREFEYEVARIIERTTGKKAQVVGGAGDDGIDIRVTVGRNLVGIVQCKRFVPDKALPPQHIRELAAVKAKYGVKTAYLVTSGYFSDLSRAEASNYGIKLMDGNDLEALRRMEYASEVDRVRREAQTRPSQKTYLQ